MTTIETALDRILPHGTNPLHLSDVTNIVQARQLLYAARDMGWIDLNPLSKEEIDNALTRYFFLRT